MKRLSMILALSLALPALAACAADEPSATELPQGAAYTCCEAKDIETVYRPGQAMMVRWKGGATAGAGSPDVELAARLTGPYPSEADLKTAITDLSAAAGAVTFSATPLRPSGTAGDRPVSAIAIGSDAKPGFYGLIFSVQQDGGTVAGASIVRVATN